MWPLVTMPGPRGWSVMALCADGHMCERTGRNEPASAGFLDQPRPHRLGVLGLCGSSDPTTVRPTCQICNIGLKNRVPGRWTKLSRLHMPLAWIRFDSRIAGATAVRVGLAATQGWGERGPSALSRGIGTDSPKLSKTGPR